MDNPQETSEAAVNASKAFQRFATAVCLDKYDLRPTPNIVEVAFDHVDRVFCFFNRIDRKVRPYLFAIRAFDQWWVCPPYGEPTKAKWLWVSAYEKATPTIGYVELLRTGDGWVSQGVM